MIENNNETFDIDNFADCGRLAIAYRDTLAAIEVNEKALWRYVRGEKRDDGKYTPVFLPGAEESIKAIQEAEEKLVQIEADAIDFKNIMGECRSIRELVDSLKRAQGTIQGVERDARNTHTREMAARRELSPAEVEELDNIRELYLKRDKVVTEFTPIVTDLQKRLLDANKILAKY